MTLSMIDLRALWGPNCVVASQRSVVPMWTGVGIEVNKRCVEAFGALNQVLKHYNYKPRSGVTGAYVCRQITGGIGLSLHAFGIAVDINWDKNLYHNPLVTDMPSAMVNAIKAIRTKGGLTVFRWGGDYTGTKDAMHYEVVISPAQLAVGINWATVAGDITPPVQPPPKFVIPVEAFETMPARLLQAAGDPSVFVVSSLGYKRHVSLAEMINNIDAGLIQPTTTFATKYPNYPYAVPRPTIPEADYFLNVHADVVGLLPSYIQVGPA